eukprot:6173751-Pleurochrysis_carterae.AAC.1
MPCSTGRFKLLGAVYMAQGKSKLKKVPRKAKPVRGDQQKLRKGSESTAIAVVSFPTACFMKRALLF